MPFPPPSLMKPYHTTLVACLLVTLGAGWLLAAGPAVTKDELTAAGPDGFRHNGVTAHRGAQEQAPENTLQAFANAIRDGADWVELDIFTTQDGQLVVIHDDTTGRVGDRDLRVN